MQRFSIKIFFSKLTSSQPRNKSALRGHYVDKPYKANVLPNFHKQGIYFWKFFFVFKMFGNVHLYSDPSSQDWCKSARLSTSLRINWRTEISWNFLTFIFLQILKCGFFSLSRIQIQLQILSVFEIRQEKI